MLSAAGRYHFLYFVAIIFFGSFYLVNLILAIVSMSYLEQQKQVEAEHKEHERRKTEDKLQLKDEEARKGSEAHTLLHIDNGKSVENALCFKDSNRKMSSSNVSIEHEQNESVQNDELDNVTGVATTIPTSKVKRKSIFVLSLSNLPSILSG